jgi:hypothetical protein
VLVTTAIMHKLLIVLPTWQYAVGMFASNVVIISVTVEILRAYGRKQRKAEEKLSPQPVKN